MSARMPFGARFLRSRTLAVAAAVAVALTTGRASAEGEISPPPATSPRRAEKVATIATEFPVSASRVVDVDGDGLHDFLVVGTAGEVRTWRHEPWTPATSWNSPRAGCTRGS